MEWIARDEELPPEGIKILIFSPEYPEGNPMRFRTIESQFFRQLTDATHWARLIGPVD